MQCLATKFEANWDQLLRSDLVLLWVKTEGKKGEKKGRKRGKKENWKGYHLFGRVNLINLMIIYTLKF